MTRARHRVPPPRLPAVPAAIALAAIVAACRAGPPAPTSSAPAAGATPLPLEIGAAERWSRARGTDLALTVPDVQGTYTIPYIQSGPTLNVKADFAANPKATIDLSLAVRGKTVGRATLSAERAAASFAGLSPGEYSLAVDQTDGAGRSVLKTAVRRIGIGTVIAALGDSITEGYFGRGYMRQNHLSGADFPQEAVSRDGRNFPQFAPTAKAHLPKVNCFESWMTDLNDLLAESLGWPAFIANEGWGLMSTGTYLRMMQTDAGWRKRMRLLSPNVWLIHLGVNDGRARTAPKTVRANLQAIVGICLKDYGAQPRAILVAKPSYDYHPGAAAHLEAYCREIDALVKDMGLSAGPDLYSAFAADRGRWYGADPVHPNLTGMERMAGLWHDAILAALRRDKTP